MEFKKLSKKITDRFNHLSNSNLFKMDISKDDIWQKYLSSFPKGTNEIYKERTEHDCQCCKQFVVNIGNVVSLENGVINTVWDVEIGSYYQVVVDALAAMVRGAAIRELFLHTESSFGQEMNTQVLESGDTINWDHFNCTLPRTLVTSNCRTIIGKATTNKNVYKRGLDELTLESMEIVLDLINQKSLYKGDEFKVNVKQFLTLKEGYDRSENKEIYLWETHNKPNALLRSTVIGTLLIDISNGVDINTAVGSFEAKVAPTNYKRSSAPITKAMVGKAMEKIEELGIRDSLDRRFAVVEDISINNVIFADRGVSSAMKDSLMEDLLSETVSTKSYDGVGEIGIEEFIKDIVPNISSMELEVKNSHANNFVALIGPKEPDAAKVFQWDNRFSWSYAGNITDSIKERVKRAGGSVEGDVRASLAWFNGDDLDIHLFEPNGNEIGFNRKLSSYTGGKLDVDMNAGGPSNRVNPVENITYPSLNRMPDGDYRIMVHQYTKRSSSNGGFEVEIALGSKTQLSSYIPSVRSGERIDVATIRKSGENLEIINVPSHIETTGKSKEVWNVSTEKFQKVAVMCLSPNHWDDQEKGNKHYMFMLEGCKNPEPARGIYNEFLRSDLTEHRKVLEMVGEKTKCAVTGDQLSGLGFSSTQRSSLIVKVEGNFNRTLKINF